MGKQQPYRPVKVPPPLDGSAKAEAAPPPPAPTEEVAAKARDLPEGMKVRNLTDTWFVQPVTCTRIDAGEEKVLAYDGWLLDQIAAGHFAKVT